MKPDWKDAPKWANYLAMDKDGEWFWFERDPSIEDRMYPMQWVEGGQCSQAVTYHINWKETKEARPK